MRLASSVLTQRLFICAIAWFLSLSLTDPAVSVMARLHALVANPMTRYVRMESTRSLTRRSSEQGELSFASEHTDFSCCKLFSLIIYSYVQVLEHQHAQLIAGLHELYRRALNGDRWIGPRLEVVNHNQPLTHKILEALGVLQPEEWEETESVDGTWQGFEGQWWQGQDNDGWMCSESPSLHTQATFSPTSPTQIAFPQSTIMSKRQSKFQINLPPPLPMTTSACVKPEPYNHAFPNQMPTPLDTITPNESINMGFDRVADSMMDWSFGMDDLFGNLGCQERSVKGN